MSNYLISFSLTILGTLCAICGISFYIREKGDRNFRVIMLGMGLFSFINCLGYAVVGVCKDYHNAYIARCFGLFGVIFFLITDSVFLAQLLMKNPRRRHLYTLFLCILGGIDYLLFSSQKVLSFTQYNGRTCIYAPPSFGRFFHDIYVTFLFISMFTMGISWLKRVTYQRDQLIIKGLFTSNLFMLVTSLSDTILPMWDFPSFPGSCYGVSAVCLSMWYVATRMNAFSISIRNLESYIFEDNSTSILLFDAKGKLALYNNHALEFLSLNDAKGASLHDLFEITESDANQMITDILSGSYQEQYRLQPRNSSNTCSLIIHPVYDKYKDPYCITCFVYDLSKELSMLREVEQIRQNLQIELKQKTYALEKLTLQSITTIANTIDAKDAYTKGHSSRVSEYSALLAKSIGWDDEDVQNLKYIALLHDIGKIGVPDTILCKPGKLTDVEFKIIKTHAQIGGEILKDITMLPHIAEGAKYHHEKYDGTGYPCGLKGNDIPIIARIICIADSYDAMSSKRVYRDQLDSDYIRNELQRCRGTQFDPYLTDHFLQLLDDGKLDSIQDHSAKNNSTEHGSSLLDSISEALEKQPQESKHTDFLTGLFCSTYGKELITKAMKRSDGCLFMIHLNNLNAINDRYGHLAGDALLKTTVESLKSQAPKAIFARTGGDLFLGYMNSIQKDEVEQIATGILHTFHSLQEQNNKLKEASLSIGIYITSQNENFATAYNNADKALYYMKQNQIKGYFFYQSEKSKKAEDSVDLKNFVDSLHHFRSGREMELSEYHKLRPLYEYINTLILTNHKTLTLIMITVTVTANTEDSLEQHDMAMNYMKQAISGTISHNDLSMLYSSEQYLLLLDQDKKEACQATLQAIFDKFYKIYGERNILCNYENVFISARDL